MANIQYTFEPNKLQNPSAPDVSVFGTPVIDAVEFLSGSYKTPKGVNSFEGLIVQDCLIDVERVKNIVITQTQGEAGDYIEYIGNGNYSVTITGNLNDIQGAYPEEDFARLMAILDAPAILEVSCNFLNRLGIFALVVVRHSKANGGYVNQQSFTIEAKQYINLELKRK